MNSYSPRGFSFLPPIVKNLLIINGILMLANITFETVYKVQLADFLGLHYFDSELFKPWQYITYMFMHAGFEHLLFNMFALWMFGYVLENYWGGKKFLFYYLVTGVGAAIIQTVVLWYDISGIKHDALIFHNSPSPETFLIFMNEHFQGFYNPAKLQEFANNWSINPVNPEYHQQAGNYIEEFINIKMNIPTVGASGAVFGILLAFGMMFPNTLIYIYFLFPIKAKWFVIIYGALELFFGVTNSHSNVAHFAHLGGMIFGFFLIRYWKKNNHDFNI